MFNGNPGSDKPSKTGKARAYRIVLLFVLAAALLLTGASARDFQPAKAESTTVIPAGDKVDLTVVSDTAGGALSVSNEEMTMPQVGPTPTDTLVKLKDAGVPMISMGGMEIPLVAFSGMAVWALLNLILGILGVLLIVIGMVFRASRGRDMFEKFRSIALTLAIIAGAFGVIFFIVTENTKNLMVMFDETTIVNIIAFIVVLTAVWVAFRRKTAEEPEVDSLESCV